MRTLDEVINDASMDGRICAQPRFWTELWELLLDRRQIGARWEPPLPLILAAWWDASDLAKQLRFRLHICWAAEHGALDAVDQYLCRLSPADWYMEN